VSIAGSCSAIEKQRWRKDEFFNDHDAGDRNEPKGHQWRVIVGSGKRKPSLAYKLCATVL
jgi:hypothetical protein